MSTQVLGTRRRVLGLALSPVMAGAMVLGAGVIGGQAAHAAARDGVCDPGEFCYYFNSNHQGSVSDLPERLGTYGDTQPECYEFKSPGLGQRECQKNQAASVWNRTDKPINVYFHSNFGGESQTFGPGAKENLRPGLKNQNASHAPAGDSNSNRVASPVPGRGIGTPYGKSGSWSKGYHTGDDYPAPIGTNVVAVRNGRVTAHSGGSLGTYAVLHADNGRFYWYAHLQTGSIRTGQVRAGDAIGKVGMTGRTSGPHLHFEDNASATKWGTDRRPRW